MAENRASGPQVGQTVIYTASSSSNYPAIIVSVSATTGLVRLTTFPPGGTTADQQSVPFDPTGVTAGSWRYPDTLAGI